MKTITYVCFLALAGCTTSSYDSYVAACSRHFSDEATVLACAQDRAALDTARRAQQVQGLRALYRQSLLNDGYDVGGVRQPGAPTLVGPFR